MVVVLHLVGLPLIVGPMDICHFFTGLTIYDGDIHKIGWKIGEARCTISRVGGFIKKSSVDFFLNSKEKMQKTIEMKELITKKESDQDLGYQGLAAYLIFVLSTKEESSNSGYDFD